MDLEDPWANPPEEARDGLDSLETDEEKQQEDVSCWKRSAMWVCGLSSKDGPKLSAEEKEALERKLTDIEEEPLWRNVCNINAIIVLTVNVFMWGYFA